MAPNTDHPRACGELCTLSTRLSGVSGSSPRMRGTLIEGQEGHRLWRIIPAHAGNSPRHPPDCPQLSDHPRACGELSRPAGSSAIVRGSSPRMRGTHNANLAGRDGLRIIPAHAGNSLASVLAAACSADHPRACGELFNARRDGESDYGSSPRMRGTLARRRPVQRVYRIIPAHAGNSSQPHHARPSPSDHPRACGELPGLRDSRPAVTGSSPRMRGTRVRRYR